MHVRRHIALAHASLKFHFKHDILGEGGNVLIRIEHFNMLVAHDVPGGHRTLLVNAQGNALWFIGVHAQANLLDVQNDISDVFKNTVHSGEFMLHADDFHRHKGRTLKGRQKNPAHCIADGGAVAPFQRFANEFAMRDAGGFFFAHDLIGLYKL